MAGMGDHQAAARDPQDGAMSRRHPIALLALLAGLACLPVRAPTQTPSRHNVLLVVADDLGTEKLAAYGETASPPSTPTLDSLAARGVRFRSAWADALCSPTRACILTGRYAFRTGVGWALPVSGGQVLRVSETTLPEALDGASAGYAHAAFGKWHLGDQQNGGALAPNVAGFSHFAGMILGWLFPPLAYDSWPRTVDGVTEMTTAYATTVTVDDALAWLRQQPEPWFCYVAFYAPHDPFHAPPAHLHHQDLAGRDPATEPLPFYKAMVEAMDHELGRLLDAVDPTLARTDVIFVGDNGTPAEVVVPPLRPDRAKASPYEGGVRVPLIVAGPSVAAGGRECASLVAAVDLFPTVLELAGVDPTQRFRRIDGVSLGPLLRDPAAPSPRASLYTELFAGADPWRDGFVAARDPRFKLIRRYASDGSLQEEAFDLETDPHEERDLLVAPLEPLARDRISELAAAIATVRDQSFRVDVDPPGVCVGSAGPPAVDVTGAPRLGETYRVALADAPARTPALLLLGVSTTHWGALRLPLDLTLLGAGSGCVIPVSGEHVLATTTDGGGHASREIPVPRDVELVGAFVHHAWMVIDLTAPANPLGATVSNAAHVRLGR
jgi:arylsulfatase A-like enzyme